MGKASRWFRALLGSKKKSESTSSDTCRPAKKGGVAKYSNGSGRRNAGEGAYGATRVSRNEDPSASPYVDALDANKHAIAVAAATAAVAEAAMAAAQAAAAVVRLTSGNRTAAAYVNSSIERRREWAAVKIQSEFRAYLARRALRALKGLVKLQALVRGRIVRKQSASMLRRMQTMARIQARASANRTLISDPSGSSTKASRFDNPAIATPRKYDPRQHSFSAKHNASNLKKFGSKLNAEESNNNQDRTHLASHWLHRWMEECARNSYGDISRTKGCGDHDESTDKILEIDTWKPRLNPRSSEKTTHNSQFSSRKDNAQGMRTVKSLSRHLATHKKPNPSVSSGEVSSLRSPAFDQETDQPAVWPLDHSPSVRSTLSRPGSSSRGGPFTPPKSECSRSLFGDYLGHPNYMANTESYLAKVRSQSAPRQRMQFETIGSRTYVDGLLDVETNSEKSWSLHANFRNKANAGSGRSDRVRTPDHRNAVRSSSPFGLSQ